MWFGKNQEVAVVPILVGIVVDVQNFVRRNGSFERDKIAATSRKNFDLVLGFQVCLQLPDFSISAFFSVIL